MNPGIYNATVEQGSTFERVFTITDTSLNLSVYSSIRMSVRRLPGTDIIWNSTAATPGGSIAVEGTDRIRLLIDAATTALWKFDEAGYDIELVTAGTPEKVDKLLKGKLLLNKEYTR